MSTSSASSPSSDQLGIISHVTGDDPSDTLVIAGPGSGKTRTLVGSIAALVTKNPGVADKIVAISFTNNSAAELKVRLAHMAKEHTLPALHRVQVSTFHAWVGQLQARHVEPWSYPPIGLKSASLAVALDLKNCSVDHRFGKAEISAADRHMEGCETFAAMEQRNFNRIGESGSDGDNRIAFDALKLAVDELEPAMAECQIGTFGTQMKAGTSLAADLKLGDIEWLFIDEAQDMNATQAEFAHAVQSATGCKVFVIADDDQGIYKFRGASNAFLRDFGEKAGTTTFMLEENFRSTTQIVQTCVNWIRPNWEELGTQEKHLHSGRGGLPVVVLVHPQPGDRGRHAKILIDACKKAGLLKTYGEAAILGYSSAPTDYEIGDSKLAVHAISDQGLPQEIFEAWIGKLRISKATGNWHHDLWQEFLDEVTADQQAAGDARLGFPGLGDLYAAVEVFHRLHPGYPPAKVAEVLEATTCGCDENGKATEAGSYALLGSRPDPDYAGDKANYISFHSSKGMEFPVVWVTSGPFCFAPASPDKSTGQPNLMGELGEWAVKVGKALKRFAGGKTEIDEDKLNLMAEQMENRRLLYVAMSRASDLLMISAPLEIEKVYNDKQREENERRRSYKDALQEAFAELKRDDDFVVIRNDDDAERFAASITAAHRNPHWEAPKRYKVESFTSLSGQILPGEVREAEIPKDREYPRPQIEAAMVGDQFHRIMHLLCMEPEALDQCLVCGHGEDLAERVTTDPSPALQDLLSQYFGDITNKPWKVLEDGGCRSEVPFTTLVEDPATGEEILVKGFLDLVKFNDAGEPDLILDYKTGNRPEDDKSHAEQLALYRDALAMTYEIDPTAISMINYYVADKAWVER